MEADHPGNGVLIARLFTDLGYFVEEGLTVDFRFEDDRSNVMAAMESGDIDADMRTVGEHQGRPRVDETPGTIIGTIDLSLGGDGVIVDDTVAEVADLKDGPSRSSRTFRPGSRCRWSSRRPDFRLMTSSCAKSRRRTRSPSSPIRTSRPWGHTSRNPRILVSSRETPDLIIDIITARDEELAANPEKFGKFLRGIYRAIDFHAADPARFAELAAPHFGSSAEEVTEIVDTPLACAPYEQAVAFLGTPDAHATLHDTFDQIMEMNLEFGAAEVRLDPAREIDPSVLGGLFDGETR